MTADEIASIIEDAAARHGVPTDALMAIANLESSGNINADNPRSSASGLFQFVDSTAREYGLTGNKRNDPAAQADAAAKMMATNARSLERTLGRPANAGELYLAHQQGLGGARALLTNPGRPAVDVLTGVYGDRNRAAQAVRLNGGNLNQSAGQFAGQWVNKANQRASLIPPANIPNVVASRLDTERPTPPLPRPRPSVQGKSQAPTSAASKAYPTHNVTPRLAPNADGIFAYSAPDMKSAHIAPGKGSLTPDFFSPRPQVRLPDLPPSNIASNRVITTSIERANEAVDPALRSALARQAVPSSAVNQGIANAQAAVDPGLLRALEARNAPGVGQPPATRSVPSVAVPKGPPANPLSRDSVLLAQQGAYMGRALPNFKSQVQPLPVAGVQVPNSGYGPSPVMKTADALQSGVYPAGGQGYAVGTEIDVVPPVGFPPLPRPRPVQMASVPLPRPRPAHTPLQPVQARAGAPVPPMSIGRLVNVAFPTSANQRPMPPATLKVQVQGANSYSGGSGGGSQSSQPQTIKGSSTGREYNVGQQYQSGGYRFEAQSDGTFKNLGRV